MSKAQQIIRYIAIALAMFLTVSILSAIASGIVMIGNIFSEKNNTDIIDKLNELDIDGDIKLLSVDIKSSNVLIKTGDKFKAETSNKYIKCNQNKDRIYITEKSNRLFSKNNKSNLIIYIPEDMILDGVNINNGAGKVKIEKLKTKILDLDLGAGKVNIENLTVLNNSKIEGGAGEITIKDSSLNNMDLNMGVGKFTLEAAILGNSKIDHGVGSITLNLIGAKEEYQIHVDKGIGTITIDNKNINDNQIIGNGINKIDIDGGIGNMDINFNK